MLNEQNKRELVDSVSSAQRIVFAPEFASASLVAAAWTYHFGSELTAGEAYWYALPSALLLATVTVFCALASFRVWRRKPGWTRWLVAAWLISSLLGLILRVLVEK